MPKAEKKRPVRKIAKLRILGVTSDGVAIIRPPGRATHFTDKELREAIASVISGRTARRAGTSKTASNKK